MAGKQRVKKGWIRSGDRLLIVAAGLLGALGEAAEFPQDRVGIEGLIAGAGEGPEGERLPASYEAPDAEVTYLAGNSTWVAPAGDGRLRIRQRAMERDRLASRIWLLGPDGSLGDPETIEGYGVPEDELTAAARAELEQIERRRRDAAARRPEEERRNQERLNRHRVEHLLGVVAGPAGQDPTGPVVSHVVLYDTGTLVHYLAPRPAKEDLDPDDPFAESEAAPKPTLDDGLGTKFSSPAGTVDPNGEGMLRCRREFAPAVPARATRLVIELDATSVAIELERS